MAPKDIVASFYAAVAKGDVPGVMALLAPELHWLEAKGFPYYGGLWTKPQQILEGLLMPLARDWAEFHATPNEILDIGDRVITFGAYSGTAKATGKSMEAPFAHVWRTNGAQITGFGMYTDTALIQEALRA